MKTNSTLAENIFETPATLVTGRLLKFIRVSPNSQNEH